MSTPHTVALYTLGCKLNFSESSSMAQKFEEAGYRVVDFDDGASIYVVNTCSVTNQAEAKCRNIVRRAHRHSPGAKVVVTGCYAQLRPEEIAEIEGVDLVLGAAEKFRILDFIDQLSHAPEGMTVHTGDIDQAYHFESAYSMGDRTRTFLKVQDGCSYNCSFCTIPKARGKSRSDTVENVLEKARGIAKQGVKEIVLTGVNIGDFGKGQEIDPNGINRKEEEFVDLIRALDGVEGIDRFRISSIEPNLCSDEIIEFVAQSDKFMPHLHMPLQSGNDKILAQMRRRYQRELYTERVEKIKTLMPHACIGVDVIVGFPGESDEDFLESYTFIRDMDISYLHVFTYSQRPGTPAADREDQVPVPVRKERNAMLRNLSDKKQKAFYRQHLGDIREVLLEQGQDDGYYAGYTDNYIRVHVPPERAGINHLKQVELESINEKGSVNARIRETVRL